MKFVIKMCYADNEKREKWTTKKKNNQIKKTQNIWKKYKYLAILDADTIK